MLENSPLSAVIKVCKSDEKKFHHGVGALNHESLKYALALCWLGRFGVENRHELSSNYKSSTYDDDYSDDDLYEDEYEEDKEPINIEEEWGAFFREAGTQTNSGTPGYILSKRHARRFIIIGLGLKGMEFSGELYQNLEFFDRNG